MVKKKLPIIIDREVRKSLKKDYRYIKKDSLQNAEKVIGKIMTAIKGLEKNSERHGPDKYRLDNDGSFRAFEIYKYRITYHISADEIRIIRFRHTKMNPLEY